MTLKRISTGVIKFWVRGGGIRQRPGEVSVYGKGRRHRGGTWFVDWDLHERGWTRREMSWIWNLELPCPVRRNITISAHCPDCELSTNDLIVVYEVVVTNLGTTRGLFRSWCLKKSLGVCRNYNSTKGSFQTHPAPKSRTGTPSSTVAVDPRTICTGRSSGWGLESLVLETPTPGLWGQKSSGRPLRPRDFKFSVPGDSSG